MPNNDAVRAAQSYLRQEPDAHLREQTQELLASVGEGNVSAIAKLQDCFLGKLSFGTAGIRAKMEPGFARLNKVTIAKAAYAIGTFFVEHGGSVVVAYDARQNSKIYSQEVAAVMRGLGFFVYEFGQSVATPICAFSVRLLSASAGIMVTASHNPPQDNGIKVYASSGAQIISPTDRIIEQNLRASPSYENIKKPPFSKEQGQILKMEEVFDHYLEELDKSQVMACVHKEATRVVYTPMHGVGFGFLEKALSSKPWVKLLPVEKQKDPDGIFPTVSFPNPEEEGALDLALLDAKKLNADLIIANDPDADRLAVCVPSDDDKQFKMLSGNEVGALLGAFVLENIETEKKKLVVTTLVSSRQLRKIAEGCGASYAESLTGFSKIAQVAMEREKKYSEQFVFGFEEALGYCVGDFVRDKDGICAAVRILELYSHLKKNDKSFWEELDRIALKYGLFRNMQWSFRYEGTDAKKRMGGLMRELRKLEKGSHFLGTKKITKKFDLLKEQFQDFSQADILVFFLDDGTRIVVRPSGTEPKVKFYAEMTANVSSKEMLDAKSNALDRSLLETRQQVNTAIKELVDDNI